MARKPKSKDTPLSDRAMRFVDEYPKDTNATKAAERSGYSSRTAGQQGHRLLKDPRVAALVDERLAALAKKAQMQADEVLTRIAHMGRADIAGAYDDNNCLKPIKDIPDAVRLSIAAIETEEIFEWVGEGDARHRELVGYTKKVKFWDKKGSLELLGRHHKLFTDRKELSVDESLGALIAAAAKK